MADNTLRYASSQAGEVSLRDLDIIFFDCEFSGLTMGVHELIEIGYVKARKGTFEKIAEGDIKLLPRHIETADPAALKISGYDGEEWAREGVDLKVGLEKFLSVANGCLLAGHNTGADIRFLHKSLFDVGLSPNFSYKTLDTLSLAWFKFRDDPAFRTFSLLKELAPHFKIDTGREHRAIDDARTTYEVFKKLIA